MFTSYKIGVAKNVSCFPETTTEKDGSSRTNYIHNFNIDGNGFTFKHSKPFNISNGDEVKVAIPKWFQRSEVKQIYNRTNKNHSMSLFDIWLPPFIIVAAILVVNTFYPKVIGFWLNFRTPIIGGLDYFTASIMLIGAAFLLLMVYTIYLTKMYYKLQE